MKVVLCTRLFDAGVKYLSDKVCLSWHINQQPKDILTELKDADAVVLGLQKLDGETIRSCPNLKVIAKQGVGFDNVDEETATHLGIPIVITPGANSRSVAEHTMCCILAAFKNLRREVNFALAGDFSKRNECEAYELYGKTVGILGFGKIGQQVAEMCRGFAMKVVAYDPFLHREEVEAKGVQYVETVKEVLQVSDAVTIHVPLTPETEHLISYRELAWMKPTACLINCARGSIVDESALLEAVQNKQIFCAALDAWEREPIRADNPLLALDNLIPTPHVAALTKEASAKMGKMVGEGVWAILKGERYPYVGNPSVYRHPKWQ